MDDRLYRSRSDRMIAGVAGGLAEHYDLDPSLVRIGWALLILFTGGLFLLLYIVMVIVVPDEPWAGAPAAPTGTDGWAGAPAPSSAVAGTGPTTDPSPAGSAGAEAGSPATETAGAAGTVGAAAPAMSSREARRAARRQRRDNSSAPLIVGAVLVIIGGLAFAGQVFPQLDFDLIWPIGLILLGVALVVGATRRSST
ncbi:MAG TPA: PspC domain-containing protein [Candidatus Saccharimonadia bacterium]|nr:PspC domain-containing protein [Candidatus Saccharimonadia bacterium]